jgi:hypothetical protein
MPPATQKTPADASVFEHACNLENRDDSNTDIIIDLQYISSCPLNTNKIQGLSRYHYEAI